jgi:hypothetical protein
MDRMAIMIKWMMDNWKPACALIYTVICLFDFVVFPCWVGWHRLPVNEFLSMSQGLDVQTKTSLLEYLYRSYSPYTLAGGGLFHLSFGAILTGVAFAGKPTMVTDRREHKTEEKVNG